MRHIRHWMERALAIRPVDAQDRRPMVRLVNDLLDGADIPPSTVERKLADIGWSADGPFLIVRLVLIDSRTADMGLRVPMLRSNVQLAFPGALVMERDDAVFVLFRVERSEGWVTKTYDALKRMGRAVGCHCIVGNPFPSLPHIRTQLEQTQLAVPSVERLRDPRIISLADVFDQVVARELLMHHSLADICHPVVAELVENEKGYGLDQLICLMTYLENERSATITSRLLYTHKNTVHYRMGKIEKMLGKKLAELNPSERLYLLLSCKMALHELGR